MKVPQLRKKLEIKSCHNTSWEDNYSWIHQKDILEVLKDKNKLNPEVKKYLIEENNHTDYQMYLAIDMAADKFVVPVSILLMLI